MIAVSACLCGIACRMDGRAKEVKEFRRLYEEGKALPLCPETAGGLPVPRPASEIRDGRVINSRGEDVTEAFLSGSLLCLKEFREKGCTGAVLKSKSPACGLGTVYDGSFSGRLVKGNGIFAEMLAAEGVPVCDENTYFEERSSIPEGER